MFPRLDSHLVSEGLVPSRSKAAHLIRTGAVRVNGITVTKQARVVRPGDVVELDPFLYVGRGGYKLQAALDRFKLECTCLEALDIGCSEGGFTDCLLRNGAASVTSIDIASDVINTGLRQDPRVHFIGGVDASDPDGLFRALGGKRFSLVVMDVTARSLDEMLPAVSRHLDTNGHLVALLKPQYEEGREYVDDEVGREVLRRAFGSSAGGLTVTDWMESPIRGGSKNRGNREFLLLLLP